MSSQSNPAHERDAPEAYPRPETPPSDRSRPDPGDRTGWWRMAGRIAVDMAMPAVLSAAAIGFACRAVDAHEEYRLLHHRSWSSSDVPPLPVSPETYFDRAQGFALVVVVCAAVAFVGLVRRKRWTWVLTALLCVAVACYAVVQTASRN